MSYILYIVEYLYILWMEITEFKNADLDQIMDIVMQVAMEQKILPRQFKMTKYAYKLMKKIASGYLEAGYEALQVITMVVIYLRGYVEGLRDGAILERNEIQGLA